LPAADLEIARDFARASKAAATRRAYQKDFARFTAWCAERDLSAVPGAPETVAAFLAAEAARGIKPANIGRRVAATAMATLGRTLLSPTDHTLALIDFQSQMAFATESIDGVALGNNATLVANAARIFNVSTILATVAEKTFSGPMFDEIKAAFSQGQVLRSHQHEPLEDKAVIEEVSRIGNGRVALASLWTSVCIFDPALSALDQGFSGLRDRRRLRRRIREGHMRAAMERPVVPIFSPPIVPSIFL
jgi:hypothetical protein